MTAAKKVGRKKQPAPGTTAVKDRFVGFPLGREAQMLAEFLRGCGAVVVVPDLRDDAARMEWLKARQDAATVPMWYLDWAAVILEQIPERPLRKAGRPKTDAVERVETWALVMPVADAARMEATMEARKRGEEAYRRGEEVPEDADAIEKRAEDLAHQVYRHRKPDVT
jgi:hypothetical protein